MDPCSILIPSTSLFDLQSYNSFSSVSHWPRLLDTLQENPDHPIDWMVALALVSSGWFTENPQFFSDLLTKFLNRMKDGEHLSVAKLRQEMHLVENRRSVYLESEKMGIPERIALRINLLIFLIEHHAISGDLLTRWLEDIYKLLLPEPDDTNQRCSSRIILTLLSQLKASPLSPNKIMDCFKVALSFQILQCDTDYGLIHVNFGTRAYRLEVPGSSFACVWVAVDATESFRALIETIKQEGMEEIEPFLCGVLQSFVTQESLFRPPFTEYSEQVVDFALIETLLAELRKSKDYDLLEIALEVELKLIWLGKKEALSEDWLVIMTYYLKKFPKSQKLFSSIVPYNLQYQDAGYTLFDREQPLEIIMNPARWLFYLAENFPKSAVPYASTLNDEDKQQFREIIKPLFTDPKQFFPLYQRLHRVEGLFDKNDFDTVLFSILRDFLPQCCAELPPQKGIKYVPWVLFLLSIHSFSSRPVRVEATSKKGENLFIDERYGVRHVFKTASIFSKAFNLFKEGIQYKTICLEIYNTFFHQDVPEVSEKPISNQNIPLHELDEIIALLKKEQIDSPSYAVAIDLMYQSKAHLKKSFKISPEMLINFPDIHKFHPQIRPQLTQFLNSENAAECVRVSAQETINPAEWIRALLLSEKSHFISAAIQLWRKLVKTQEGNVDIFWEALSSFLVSKLNVIPVLLKNLEEGELRTPAATQFLTAWLNAENHNNATKKSCQVLLQQKFRGTFDVKPQVPPVEVVSTVVRKVPQYKPTVHPKKIDPDLLKRFFNDCKDWVSAIYLTSVMTELMFSLYPSVVFLTHPSSVPVHPVLFDCIFSVRFHRIITDKFQGDPVTQFCDTTLTSDYPQYLRQMIGVNILGLIAVSGLGFYNLTHLKKRKLATTKMESASKIASFVATHFNAIVSLTLFGIIYAIINHANDADTPPGGYETREYCKKFLTNYFEDELGQIDTLKIGNSTHILNELKEGICDFKSAVSYLDFSVFSTLFHTYMLAMVDTSVAKTLTNRVVRRIIPRQMTSLTKIQRFLEKFFKNRSKTSFYHLVKHKRTFIKISALAYGSFRLGVSTYSSFQNVHEGYDHCEKKTNYLKAILGESNEQSYCISLNMSGQALFLATLVSLHFFAAFTAYLYGQHGISLSCSPSLKSDNKRKITTCKDNLIGKVKRLSSPILLTLFGLIIHKINDLIQASTGASVYENYCLQGMFYRFNPNIEKAAQHNPDTSVTRNGLGFLACRSSTWWDYDAMMLPVAISFFYIAGLMSINIPQPKSSSHYN